MEQDLGNQNVVITGASRGIGAAIAENCAARGAGVAINYRTGKDEASALAARLKQEYGADIILLPFDVRSMSAIEKATEQALQHFGQIHAWINNAGVNLPGLLLAQSGDMIDEQIDVNIKGVLNGMRAILPHMLEQKNGCIVNLGSVTSEIVSPGQVVYAATKGAVASMTRAAAREYARKGIRINCVEPGPVSTDMLHVSQQLAEKEILQHIPMGRIAQAKDIAEVVCYLLTPAAGFITGSTLRADGGYALV